LRGQLGGGGELRLSSFRGRVQLCLPSVGGGDLDASMGELDPVVGETPRDDLLDTGRVDAEPLLAESQGDESRIGCRALPRVRGHDGPDEEEDQS
jgi:hypothetical protein